MRAKRVKFPDVKSQVVLLDGGLNENVSSLELKGGELIKCKNYQHVLGSQGGYKSVAGFERFDGRTKPSAVGAIESDDTAREAARSAIKQVPGSGPVRGIHLFRGQVYAFRDDAWGATCKMYKATSRGWVEIDTSSDPLAPGGSYKFFNYNFNYIAIPSSTPSSSPSSSPSGSLAVSPSEGTPSSTPSDSPSEGTPSRTPSSSPSSSPSLGTPSSSPSSSPSGSQLETPSEGTPSEGTPSDSPSDSTSNTPSASPSSISDLPDLEEMFFTNGVNEARSYNGVRVKTIHNFGMGTSDKPHNLTVHNDKLWLVYDNGSLQYSTTGNPFDWYNGAGEINVGGSITNLVPSVGNALVIFCKEGIYVLEGNTPEEWTFSRFSRRSGAYEHTANRLLGTIFFMDDRGVTSMASVDAFGDFEANAISQKVHNTIQTNKKRVTCATVSRDLNQYRLFFSNNYSLWFSFQDKELRGTTLTVYPLPVSIVTEGEDLSGNNVIFFASGNTGYVYQMDSGTSFDGAEIETALSTAYYHYKSPRIWKKFKTLVFEISTLFDMQVTLRQDFDYSSVLIPRAGDLLIQLSGTGETWGSDEWGQLVYASGSEETNRIIQHVIGAGTTMNISLYSSSKYNQQHTIQNITTDFELTRRQF